MNPEAKIIGYCRTCGKALDAASARHAYETIYCEEHVPKEPPSPWTPSLDEAQRTAQLPPSATRPGIGNSPVLAFLLGWIPGVGAIYNGQYAKGLIHVVIFGLLVSIISSGTTNGLEPLFPLLLTAFIFYMAFEAYHTAKKRSLGQPVDELSSLIQTRSSQRFPAGPILLIALGVIFLLNNLGFLDIRRVMRYWPALLIVLGVYLLITRLAEARRERR
jgi:hypothetical protein